jgi:hypothetical protein
MKTARTFFLMLALVGFIFSLITHLLALWDRASSSEYWFVVPFLAAAARATDELRSLGSRDYQAKLPGLEKFREVICRGVPIDASRRFFGEMGNAE